MSDPQDIRKALEALLDNVMNFRHESFGMVRGGPYVTIESLREQLEALSQPQAAQPASVSDERDAEIARLRTALRFYARGEHYNLDESEEFDTVSGEPQNWMCSGREDSSTMVETGRVALFALQGIDANWRDGDDDHTPLPVDGEVSCATPPTEPAPGEEPCANE